MIKYDFNTIKQRFDSLGLNEYLWIILIIVTITFTMSKYAWSIINGDFGAYIPTGDSKEYLNITNGQSVDAPWKYRILTPLIIRFIPLNHILAYYSFNLCITIITAFIFYLYLKKLAFDKTLSLLGTVLFLVSHVVLYYYFLPLVDPLNELLIIIGFYLAKIDKADLIPVIIFIGMFNHETIFILVPIYVIFSKNNLSAILFSVILGILYILFRFALGFDLGNSLLIDVLLKNGIGTLIFIFQTFLCVWLGLFNIFLHPWLKRASTYLLFDVLLIPFDTNSARVVFLMFPVLIPAFLLFFLLPENKLKKSSEEQI